MKYSRQICETVILCIYLYTACRLWFFGPLPAGGRGAKETAEGVLKKRGEHGKQAVFRLQLLLLAAGSFYFGGRIASAAIACQNPDEIMTVEAPDRGGKAVPAHPIMERAYARRAALHEARKEGEAQVVRAGEGWTVDAADGSFYFFLEEEAGWRLVVADAAAGSRFYVLEKTGDGGSTWEQVNGDPFAGNIGVAEGLLFWNGDMGFAGLSGPSQSHSSLYLTRDGGSTFVPVELPFDKVEKLPELAGELGYTVADYDYCYMPERTDYGINLLVTTEAVEKEGILFQSADGGESWIWAGTGRIAETD